MNLVRDFWSIILAVALILVWGVRLEGRVNMVEEKANAVEQIKKDVGNIKTDVAVILERVGGK